MENVIGLGSPDVPIGVQILRGDVLIDSGNQFSNTEEEPAKQAKPSEESGALGGGRYPSLLDRAQRVVARRSELDMQGHEHKKARG